MPLPCFLCLTHMSSRRVSTQVRPLAMTHHNPHACLHVAKAIMSDNIEKVLARGEQLDAVAAKADDLQAHARDFHVRGRALRRRLWWKDIRLKIAIGFALVVLILVIFFLACGGVRCVK